MKQIIVISFINQLGSKYSIYRSTYTKEEIKENEIGEKNK